MLVIKEPDDFAVHQNTRPAMEDFVTYAEDTDISFRMWGVFDGHGGDAVSKRLVTLLPTTLHKLLLEEKELFEDLLVSVFAKCETEFQDALCYGSTASIFVSYGEQCAFAHCGDSTILMFGQKTGMITYRSRDHSATNEDEVKRIRASDGFVVYGRAGGALAVSRSFGDRKYTGVVSRPEVIMVAKGEIAGSTILLASDGLWDNIPDIRTQLKEGYMTSPFLEATAKEWVDTVMRTWKGGNGDNVSAVRILCE